MKGDLGLWNYGLLWAILCIVLGVAGLVSLERRESRRLSSGVCLQGVVLVFIAGSAYLPGSVDLRLGALVVTSLLIMQNLLTPPEIEKDHGNVRNVP